MFKNDLFVLVLIFEILSGNGVTKPRPHCRCLATGRSFAVVVDLQNCLDTSLLFPSKRWRWQWTLCFWRGAISGGESSNSAQTFAQKYYKTAHTTRYCSVASAISFLAIIHHGKPTFTLNLVHNPYNQLPWSSSLFNLKLGLFTGMSLSQHVS